MFILGIITPNAKARNIGTQMKVFYEKGLPTKASLFSMTFPIDISPQTYAVQQFDHVFENVPNEKIQKFPTEKSSSPARQLW